MEAMEKWRNGEMGNAGGDGSWTNMKGGKEEDAGAGEGGREQGWQQVKHQKLGSASLLIRPDLMKF